MLSVVSAELLRNALLAGFTMLVLGTGFAVVLLIASIRLKVDIDPKVEQIHKALPNIDCGACGFAGCASYAKAVVAEPALIGRCAPGGAAASAKIAAALNLQISGAGAAQKPIVHCRAQADDKSYYAGYDGIETCISANSQSNVQMCSFGCLGYGDCVGACRFGALAIVEGLATVDYTRCTGCGACAKACPRNLIEMVPFAHDNMLTVACRSRENAKTTRSMCRVGCIGCGLCARQTDLFTVTDNLAKIDYTRYSPSGQTETAAAKCPTGVIVYRGPTACSPRPAGQKTIASAT